MASPEEDIAAKLISICSTHPTLTDVKTVNFDRVQLAISDFRDHEVPAIQFWDVAQVIAHERGRIRVGWAISLEIIMKSLTSGTVTQNELWDLRRRVQLALWETPNLNIPTVIHMIYNSNITDLHTVEPFYIARLDFEVAYYDDLPGSC